MTSNSFGDPNRPSPDALLKISDTADTGRLKIFLGPAPGVGKTYAMLQAARQRKTEGLDVVAGVVETHRRAETAVLLDGLEVLPRRQIRYQTVTLEEFDLDAALARRPSLVLIDELAHTNAPGSRHAKRYLDVQELLAAGIDVYTTLNIQHLESLNDAVRQITGITVQETIPDLFVQAADEIQLIDLPPEELINRLNEGKVYVPEQAQRAIENFFRPGTLNALRELALRRTADEVDDEVRTWMRARGIPGPWPTQDRIMVCISPSPFSARLVRAAKRRADRRNAPWTAVYVETPVHRSLPDEDKLRVARTLELASRLGGEAQSIIGENTAKDLVRYAQTCNATEIIIGKSLRSRLSELLRGSIVGDLIKYSGPVDIYVVGGKELSDRKLLRPLRAARSIRLRDYLDSLVMTAAATAAGLLLANITKLPAGSVSLIYLLSVLVVSLRSGLWPAIFACAASGISYNFFFIEPRYTLSIATFPETLAFFVFLFVVIVTSNLTARVREQAEAARERESQTSALFAFSRAVIEPTSLEAVAEGIINHAALTLNTAVAIIIPFSKRLIEKCSSSSVALSEADRGAAIWAIDNNQLAGAGTETLPAVRWTFVPLRAGAKVVGVLGVHSEGGFALGPFHRQRLLEGLAEQSGLAIDRIKLLLEREETQVIAETERLRSALLSSISHDLRTPLASILGSVTSLINYGSGHSADTRSELLEAIREEAERLNRFVGNLLDITRLEAQKLDLNKQWVEIGEVIGSAAARLNAPWSTNNVSISVPPDLPLLRLDFSLMEQVVANLLENAAKYSVSSSTIEISAYQEDAAVIVTVRDEGVGIPVEELDAVFDKFYRVRRADRQEAGTGLGLAICRGIIEAHGGTIRAEDPPSGKGAVLVITLPIEMQPPETQPAAE